MQQRHSPNYALFKYIDENDEENALEVLKPEDIHCYLKSSGDYVLHLAIKKGFIRLALKLIKLGSSPYVLNEEKENPLSLVISQGKETKDAVIALLKSKVPVTEDIGSAILSAVIEDEVGIARLLLEKAGQDMAKRIFKIWTQGKNKSSCLHITVTKKSSAMFALLMSYGADPYVLNEEKENPLSLAISQGKGARNVVITFLKSNVPVTEGIGSAILSAVIEDEVEIARLLLEKAGQDMAKRIFKTWTQGKNKNTCLHIAVIKKNSDMVALLMNYGADPYTKNEAEKSAIDLAKNALDDEILTILVKEKTLNNKLPDPLKNSSYKKITAIVTNSSSSNHQNTPVPELRGRSGKQYANFIEYISTKEINMDDLDTLGSVDHENPKYYFKMSEKSNEYARSFLNLFFANSENIKSALDFHQYRYKEEQEKNSNVECIFPSCISFIAATVNGQEHCYITASFTDDTQLFETVCRFANKLNQSGKFNYSYIVLGGQIGYYNEILRYFLKDNYVYKGCSEKYYSKFFIKLYLEYGKDAKIIGISNCTMVLQEKGVGYGDRSSDATNKTIRPYTRGTQVMNLDNGYFVNLIPCCKNCQTNKFTILKIFKGAQDHKEEYLKPNELGDSRQRIELSPIRNSIFTQLQKERNEEENSNGNLRAKLETKNNSSFTA